jgi:proteasome lid subunit RPN8/RPN11
MPNLRRGVTGLALPRAVAGELLDHARAQLPNEACGFLSGSLSRREVTAFHPARNADASPLRFTVHPEDQVRLTFAIERDGQDLVGIFHSHVREPAIPSLTDVREVTHPQTILVLASLADPAAPPADALRAWRITRGRAEEVRLALI